MFGSLKLGKFFGIDTYVHPTFWLLPLFVLIQTFGTGLTNVGFNLLFVFAVFFCVAMHEVGHALAARAYGIGTRDITLYPIGGVAMLERIPEQPWREVAVALAGPAVNVVIALALLIGLAASGFGAPWGDEPNVVERFVGPVFWANVVLCGFNLLPAFPMDGGRVLRALLALCRTRLRATELAVYVGTVVAVGMFVTGAALGELGLMLVAAFVWFVGQAELANVRMVTEARRLYGPPPPLIPSPPPLDPEAELAARRFSGLAWDPTRRVWVQWVNGVPVRDIPA
ncbi:MAG: site-2 protease family protein [Planctomycetes bacterium]|nr:site-2 protease family protein [Planctomycetota bacterium]